MFHKEHGNHRSIEEEELESVNCSHWRQYYSYEDDVPSLDGSKLLHRNEVRNMCLQWTAGRILKENA